jgi:hypothetical protein
MFIENSNLTQLYSHITFYNTEYDCSKLQANYTHLLYILFPRVIIIHKAKIAELIFTYDLFTSKYLMNRQFQKANTVLMAF